jgi:type IV pilus assembly protein PilC
MADSFSRSGDTRKRAQSQRARVPGAAKIRSKELPMFTRMLAAMLDSGIPLVQSLSALEEQTGNKVFKGVITGLRDQIEGGAEFSDSLALYPSVFDELYVSMMRAGERTGKMDEMLDKVAEFYEDEVQQAVNGLTSIIEPLLMVFLGVIVGGIMLGMFMPLFKMTEILNM